MGDCFADGLKLENIKEENSPPCLSDNNSQLSKSCGTDETKEVDQSFEVSSSLIKRKGLSPCVEEIKREILKEELDVHQYESISNSKLEDSPSDNYETIGPTIVKTEKVFVEEFPQAFSKRKHTEWTKPTTLALIQLIELNQCLWQVKHVDYRNRKKKNSALEFIRSKMNLDWLTKDEITKKINTLRSQYRRELKQRKDSKKSGAGRDEKYCPKLWCYDNLKFFGDDGDSRESISTLDIQESEMLDHGPNDDSVYLDQEIDDDSNTMVSEISRIASPAAANFIEHSCTDSDYVSKSQIPSISVARLNDYHGSKPPAKKRKRSEDLDKVIAIALQKMTETPTQKHSPMADYGKVVARDLEEMGTVQSKIARKLINDVLFMGSMDLLTTNHHVVKVDGAVNFLA